MAVLLACLSGGAARAAGTGGIEVTPLPALVDGEQVTAFHVELPGRGSTEVPFLLRNVENGERTASVYAADVTRAENGTFDVSDAGSSRYVSYEQRTFSLAAGEQRRETFTLERPNAASPPGETFAAIVVEVSNGSVVQRAATLVYVNPGTRLPLPLLIVLVALVLVVLVAATITVYARRARAAVRHQALAAASRTVEPHVGTRRAPRPGQ